MVGLSLKKTFELSLFICSCHSSGKDLAILIFDRLKVKSEWFWRMEELTKRNGKGLWLRETEKCLKRYGASLEWLMERIAMREEDIEAIRVNGGMEECENTQVLRAKRRKSIDKVLEEVDVLIDSHFFNELSRTNPHFSGDGYREPECD